MLHFRAPRWGQEELAKRLCQLIYGQETVWQEDGVRWHIGSANDWWLHPQGGDRYMLHYRYSTKGRMRALAAVMSWFLHLKEVTIDDT
jgi:hypothetical protein